MICFMQRYSFATIITASDNRPMATHLPFVVVEMGEDIVLRAHFANANPQWQTISDQQVLVIFSEPHAYISPQLYDSPINVPTWNYLAVHAYGQGRLVVAESETLAILEQTIHYYEADYKKQWDTLPDDYKKRLQNGIVAFEIIVKDLQGKKKISQNKTVAERQRIAAVLSESLHSHEQDLGAYMTPKI